MNKPCLLATECARHKQMGLVKNNIVKIIEDCGFTWDGDRHLQWLKQQRSHIRMIRGRILGGKWVGSKEGEVDDEFYDVDEEFRPIAKTTMPSVLSKDTSVDPIVMPPHPDAPGHEYLDASLRDMTGVLHSRLHLMTHESHTVTNEHSPCWVCLKAASQQK